LLDVPNHTAGIHILANLDTSPFLHHYYDVEWALIPNIAIDIILPPLARLIGAENAMTLFVASALVLLAAGSAAVNRSLFGRWTIFAFVPLLFLHNRIFLWGFASQLFFTGLAMCLFAGWLQWRLDLRPVVRTAAFTLAACVLWLGHIFAFATFAILVGGWEIACALRHSGRPRAKIGWLMVGAVPFVPGLTMIGASRTFDGAVDLAWLGLAPKITGATYMLYAYSIPLDIASILLVFGVLGVLLLTRQALLHPMMWGPLSIFAALYLAMPPNLFGGSLADCRLVPVASMVLVASMAPRVQPVPWRGALACGVASLLIVRTFVLSAEWAGFAETYRDIRAAIARIEPGSRLAVAVMRHEWPALDDPPLTHVPAVAVIDRDAFVNMMFAKPGHHILTVTYNTDTEFYADPSHYWLRRSNAGSKDHALDVEQPVELIPLRRFDYLLMMRPHLADPPTKSVASLIFAGDQFALYRIREPEPGPVASDAEGVADF
jgi:hypothetical protein